MLHDLVLAPGIIPPLTQAIHVQFRLMRYAAKTTVLERRACAAFVDADPALAGRGDAAAAWVWKGSKRLEQLAAFAAHPSTAKKTAWVRVWRREALALLCATPAALTPLPRRALPWEKAGGRFLEKFYDALSSDSGLTGDLLGESAGFNRHDFLRLFSEANARLYVCAFCDEARIGTRHRGRLYADIDHFFPKSVYPHLSVHPYNLVPTCHSCNSGAKGQKDPLAHDRGGRISPRTLTLPYGSKGLAERTALRIDLAGQTRGAFRLVPRTAGEWESEITGLARNVKIPARWNDRVTASEIGETAFRRLRQFIQARPELADQQDPSLLLKKLDELLGLMKGENLGRDPHSIPIKWLLANLAQKAHDDPAAAGPLLAEIRDHLAPPKVHDEWERSGAELRRILSEAGG